MDDFQREKVEELKKIVEGSKNIVFFGGAGVSTESGIPDFRSVDGLYHQKYDYPPEEILSHGFYRSKPEEFFRFYKDKLIIKDVQPNPAHLKLAELEQMDVELDFTPVRVAMADGMTLTPADVGALEGFVIFEE